MARSKPSIHGSHKISPPFGSISRTGDIILRMLRQFPGDPVVMPHHRGDRGLGLVDIREFVFSAPDPRQPFGRQDHLRADDQGGDIAVQLRDGHAVPFDGNGVQQVLQPVEFRVRVAHGPEVIRTASRGSTTLPAAVSMAAKMRAYLAKSEHECGDDVAAGLVGVRAQAMTAVLRTGCYAAGRYSHPRSRKAERSTPGGAYQPPDA